LIRRGDDNLNESLKTENKAGHEVVLLKYNAAFGYSKPKIPENT
jgi:hypothetical protein